jgi:hypothetical protein
MKKVTIFLMCFLFLGTGLILTGSAYNDNVAPNPPTITGPTSGRIRETYTYTVLLTSPDPDEIMFNLEVDFGEGSLYYNCGCGRSWRNGTMLNISYRWTDRGNYKVAARVQDGSGAWSEWSDPLVVSMPKNKVIHTQFPWLFEIYSRLVMRLRFW